MDIFGGEVSRKRFIRSFKGIIQAPSGVVASTSSYFQRGAINLQDITDVLGSDEDFLERYKKFEIEYFKKLGTNFGRIKGKQINVELMRKKGIINLNLLDYESANELATLFKREVMRIEELFQKVGLPSIEIPSANLYRHAFKFEIDNSTGIRHPAQILLNSLTFNFNPEQEGLKSINLSRSNILGSKNLSNIWDQFKSAILPGIRAEDIVKNQLNPFSGMKQGQTILFFDTETTGVTEGSQIRSFSVRKLIVKADGSLEYDIGDQSLSKFDIGFKSEKLAGYKVADLNGGVRTLNEHIGRMEGYVPRDMGPGGKQFLDEVTKFLNELNSADKIAAHNLPFDIGMLTDTIMAQSSLPNHPQAQEALNKLLTKIEGGNFAVDTLISSRIYLQNQVQELVDTGVETDVIKKSKQFIESLMSHETLAKVHLGGSSAYAGVEGIALNTNLFELIEQEPGGAAEKLFNVLKKGSHIAETDVHLEAYITKFMHSGQLKIRSLYEREYQASGKPGGPFTEFGNWGRKIISRSSAITPTSNIADVQHLHRTVFDYLTEENVSEDIRRVKHYGVKISSTADELKGILTPEELTKLGTQQGTLSFGRNGYTFSSGLETHRLTNQDAARRSVIQMLKNAAAPETMQEINVGGTSLNVSRNIFNDSILDTGFSIAANSRAIHLAELTRNTSINIGRPVTVDQIADAMGSIYRTLGTGISPLDQINFAIGRRMLGSPFMRGIREYGLDVAQELADKFASVNDPYAYLLDPRSRVISSIFSEATTGIAQDAATAARAANRASETIAHTAHANLTTGYGISYFRSQDVTRLFDASAVGGLASSKPMITQPILKEALKRSGLENRELDYFFSVSPGKELRINAAVDIARSMNEEESLTLARKIIEVLQDNDTMSKLHTVTSDSKIARDMAYAQVRNTPEAIEELSIELNTFMRDRGLVAGYVGQESANQIIEALGDEASALENDAIDRFNVRQLKSNLTDDFIAFSPSVDRRIAEIVQPDELARAEEIEELADGTKISRVLKVIGDQAETIESTQGAARKIETQLARDKYGLPENKLIDFYLSNKRASKFVAAGIAVAGLGYYLSERHRKKALFEETLQQQPTSPGLSIDSIQKNNKQIIDMTPNRMDPLSTAGIVGNLDRSRIGHTRMGNNRYDHLYGGQY